MQDSHLCPFCSSFDFYLAWRSDGPQIESRCLHCAILAGLNLNAKTCWYTAMMYQYAVSQASSLALSDWIQTQSREEVLG